jgi:hypothetical protein
MNKVHRDYKYAEKEEMRVVERISGVKRRSVQQQKKKKKKKRGMVH